MVHIFAVALCCSFGDAAEVSWYNRIILIDVLHCFLLVAMAAIDEKEQITLNKITRKMRGLLPPTKDLFAKKSLTFAEKCWASRRSQTGTRCDMPEISPEPVSTNGQSKNSNYERLIRQKAVGPNTIFR